MIKAATETTDTPAAAQAAEPDSAATGEQV